MINFDFGRPRRVQAVVVTLMVSLSVMSLFDRTIMSIAGPNFIKEFSLSETQLGLVFSAFTFSYALFMIPGGHFADRFGPRFVLTAMGLGAALFTGLTALAGRPGLGTYIGVVPAFVAIRLGFGICTAPLYPSCGRMNANWVPLHRRGLTWGLVAAGVGLGGAISPILFAWMIARYGWRSSFWQAAAAAAALALLWFWYVRDDPAEHPRVGEAGRRLLLGERIATPVDKCGSTHWWVLLTDRNLMLLTFSYLAAGYFQYIFYFWTYYYFSIIRHMGSRAAALGTTVLFLTVMVTTPLGGWISDSLCTRYGRRLGRRIVPVLALILAPLFLYLATRLTSHLLVGAAVAIAMGLAGTCEGPVWASAIDLGGREVGAACGILNAGGNVGGFLGPLLTPVIASFGGWAWGVQVACLVSIAGALLLLAVDPTRKIAGCAIDGAIPGSVPVPN
jgi:ACS family glucarate transporter-like MFS transporter